MAAAETGNAPLVSLLLENGANVRHKDDQGEDALTWAARGGSVHVVNLLVRLADMKSKNRALFAAAESSPVVSAVVDVPARAQPSPPEPAEVTVSWTSTVEALLDGGANIEARSDDGSTPLIWAASYAETDIVKLLIQRGARLNATDKHGNTPLIAAACQCAAATMNSAAEVVGIFLDMGADVNARNHEGMTALIMASGMTGDTEILQLLLSHGADPLIKDNKGRTALALAKESLRLDKVRALKVAVPGTR